MFCECVLASYSLAYFISYLEAEDLVPDVSGDVVAVTRVRGQLLTSPLGTVYRPQELWRTWQWSSFWRTWQWSSMWQWLGFWRT